MQNFFIIVKYVPCVHACITHITFSNLLFLQECQCFSHILNLVNSQPTTTWYDEIVTNLFLMYQKYYRNYTAFLTNWAKLFSRECLYQPYQSTSITEVCVEVTDVNTTTLQKQQEVKRMTWVKFFWETAGPLGRGW